MQGRKSASTAGVVFACLMLGGCLGIPGGGSEDLVISDRRATNEGLGADAAAFAGASPAALNSAMEDGTTSAVIEGLLNRVSVIEPGPLRMVADATLAANSRAAEADLRAAMLRAEARSMNWLPSLGPQVSLTSLGAVVTQMLVEQVLFDNGAKRAERDYARADVEVAAVALAQDTNTRVLEAMELYISAEAARRRAAVNAAAMERMAHFAYIMGERVNAGISNRADLQVVQQKLDQMQSDLTADRAAMASALNELQAMSAAPVDQISGLSPIGRPSANAVALSVLKAQAESARAVAGARAARAGFLPGITLGGSVGSQGNDLGVNIAAPNGIGLGSGATIAAIEAEEAAAGARVGQETEAAARAVAALEGRLASLRQQAAEADSLARQAAQNYELFAEQQRAGLRQVTDVVGVFETKIRAERAAVDLRHDIARIEARIAAQLGTLVDGARI
ncbi:MAG: TolC family protein [Rhodobacterales bacterium]|nr:TolC family protein [Rhodobacterales bacterium]NCT12306.1 TolC family protein [Rhodobacterales bacterium]